MQLSRFFRNPSLASEKQTNHDHTCYHNGVVRLGGVGVGAKEGTGESIKQI